MAVQLRNYWDASFSEPEPFTCVICNRQFHTFGTNPFQRDEYGNNPWPISNSGRCCNRCNNDFVIPRRLGIRY